MTDYEQRLSSLSPEQRKLFEHRLKQKSQLPAVSTNTVVRKQKPLQQSTPVPTVDSSLHQLKPLQFSLIFFSEDGAQPGKDQYESVLQATRYADQHGFQAVWIPERHLHRFGGQYPNPSVLGAALAMITERIEIRSGSIVLPLHHPLRVAEEWSVVDNLSHGRVGLSFASGWVSNDFILAREPFEQRRQTLFSSLTTFQRLWRGETVQFMTPDQMHVDVQSFPRPFRVDVPIWITSSGSAETWQHAGEIGANVLTALLQQSIEDIAEKVALYRAARARHGHDPESGIVSLMLHTFVWDDPELVYQKVHDPLLAYMKTHMDLYKQIARATGRGRDAERFTEDDQAVLAEHAFARYFNNNGLFGTPDSCQEILYRLQRIGINEIACLMDFGIDTQTILASLHYINQMREQHQQASMER
jgi:natural product biosynthesis luciferase-like monooxygenase protein